MNTIRYSENTRPRIRRRFHPLVGGDGPGGDRAQHGELGGSQLRATLAPHAPVEPDDGESEVMSIIKHLFS